MIPSTAAIPLNDNEFLFKFTLKGMGKVHGRHTGPAMQEQQYRERSVVPTNENVLIYATDSDTL